MSNPYGGFTYTPNNHLVWYTSDNKQVSSYANLGFIKVLPFDTTVYSIPSFTTQMTSTQVLQNMVNYLHSRYALEGVRFQLFLFKGVHLNPSSSTNEYYYFIYLTSSQPISLSSYDIITSSSHVDMGGYLLLLSGYMPTYNLLDVTSLYPTKIFPTYTTAAWTGQDTPPSFSPNDILDVINIFTQIVTNIGTGTDPFFNGGDMAFFDSIDADFGEIDVAISDPHQIMDEILNQKKPVSYFLETYPQLMETFYENMFALITYEARGEYPYLPVE